MGGGQIHVTPALPAAVEMGPFLQCPGLPPRFTFALTLASLPVAAPKQSDFYARHDLVFRLAPSRESAVAYTDGSEGSTLAALELALQVALLDHDGLLVHAAAGVSDGRGYLMPGPSGTGKSTAARAAGFDTVLTDERVILTVDETHSRLWSTPFWSAGRSLPLSAQSAPLDTLVRLEHAAGFRQAPWAADAALTYLMQSVALYEGGPATLRAFDLAAAAVASAHCVRVGFAPTGPWPLRKRSAA